MDNFLPMKEQMRQAYVKYYSDKCGGREFRNVAIPLMSHKLFQHRLMYSIHKILKEVVDDFEIYGHYQGCTPMERTWCKIIISYKDIIISSNYFLSLVKRANKLMAILYDDTKKYNESPKELYLLVKDQVPKLLEHLQLFIDGCQHDLEKIAKDKKNNLNK